MPPHFSIEEKSYWIAWSHIGNVGPHTAQALRTHFGNLQKAWQAPDDALAQLGISPKALRYLLKRRREIDVEHCVRNLARFDIQALCIPEPDYPELLRQSPGAPYVLYVKGKLAMLPSIAIVGTRTMSRYGKIVTQDFSRRLASAGCSIVSGLALGVDACAHQAAYEANGHTVAVFGSGLDGIYPSANFHLAEQILAHGGAWISEFPPGTLVQARNFPQRNRIIAGLSLATIVIEAGEKSGALITARAALEANREVFAVPGQITSPQSLGTNRLIQEGATPLLQAAEILQNLQLKPLSSPANSPLPPVNLSSEEADILACFQSEALHLDQLIERSKMPSQRVLQLCAQLELKGCIRAVDGGQYLLQR
ncbi:MAG: DNA-protecting protein DprA [Candidatus Nomurabacteria bacterium]|nr:MAG: DNA-protecting protein DprA [Candidatus Nomurabacteria bacterium]